MTDQRERGLLDTSVVIALPDINAGVLPEATAISALTMAELSVGPHTTSDPQERALRVERVQRAEAAYHPLPFDIRAARAYGRIAAAVVERGRLPRGQRSVDMMIAATALSNGLPLFTRNRDDFLGLEELIEVIAV